MRYGLRELNLEAFLGSMDSTAYSHTATASRLSKRMADLPAIQAYSLAPANPTAGLPILLRPSIAHSHRYGNINPFPIGYAFLPHLRSRLTPGRLPLPGKPWAYGEQVFHLFYRYSCQHNHFPTVQLASRRAFNPLGTLSYHSINRVRSFGTMLSPVTFSAQNL